MMFCAMKTTEIDCVPLPWTHVPYIIRSCCHLRVLLGFIYLPFNTYCIIFTIVVPGLYEKRAICILPIKFNSIQFDPIVFDLNAFRLNSVQFNPPP